MHLCSCPFHLWNHGVESCSTCQDGDVFQTSHDLNNKNNSLIFTGHVMLGMKNYCHSLWTHLFSYVFLQKCHAKSTAKCTLCNAKALPLRCIFCLCPFHLCSWPIADPVKMRAKLCKTSLLEAGVLRYWYINCSNVKAMLDVLHADWKTAWWYTMCCWHERKEWEQTKHETQ